MRPGTLHRDANRCPHAFGHCMSRWVQGIPAAGPHTAEFAGGRETLVLLFRHLPASLSPQKVPDDGWDHRREMLYQGAGPVLGTSQSLELCPSQCSSLQRGGDRGWQCWGAGGTHRPWYPAGHTGLDMRREVGRALARGRFPCSMEAPFPDPHAAKPGTAEPTKYIAMWSPAAQRQGSAQQSLGLSRWGSQR